MLRDVDINDISDGKLYTAEDLVKITSDECKGCSECCRIVGDTILLDPLDIFNLSVALNKTFTEMIEDVIELRIVDGCILPNMMMQEETEACGMLKNGRCGIHAFRPGFCRLFPLGRIYDENGDYKYFIQVHECPYPEKGEVRVSEWLGYEDIPKYEQYVRDWHAIFKSVGAYVESCKDENEARKANWMLIRLFFEKPYDLTQDFYPQFYERLNLLR